MTSLEILLACCPPVVVGLFGFAFCFVTAWNRPRVWPLLSVSLACPSSFWAIFALFSILQFTPLWWSSVCDTASYFGNFMKLWGKESTLMISFSPLTDLLRNHLGLCCMSRFSCLRNTAAAPKIPQWSNATLLLNSSVHKQTEQNGIGDGLHCSRIARSLVKRGFCLSAVSSVIIKGDYRYAVSKPLLAG